MGGKSSKKKISSHDRALLDLKVQRDKLTQYQRRCEKVMARETELAKQLAAAGNKRAALICLKKRKLQQTMLTKAEASMSNLTTMIDSVEFAQIEVEVFASLKSGNVALGELHDQIGGIDAVEDLLLDTQEAIDRQNEIEEALGQSMAAEGIDEAEIEAELEALEESVAAEASGVVDMPDAPQHDLPTPAVPAQTKAKATKQREAVLA
eukprot:TRINITY_DN7721_c0_g1_i1.p1 TRINITY_DN7721_c0_g1~~TRINITY_DN7721_c0_g1_i1.p1  ORF type:complete len:239 (+),score=94.06 TRINITY_DN7721_c0_g1_i1:95-718(+)